MPTISMRVSVEQREAIRALALKERGRSVTRLLERLVTAELERVGGQRGRKVVLARRRRRC